MTVFYIICVVIIFVGALVPMNFAWTMADITMGGMTLINIPCCFILSRLVIKALKDFEKQVSGAVWLNEQGRKKVLTKWQEKKRTDYLHPYLKQKIPFGLIPYVQSNLLAKYVRGDLEEYPCFLLK